MAPRGACPEAGCASLMRMTLLCSGVNHKCAAKADAAIATTPAAAAAAATASTDCCHLAFDVRESYRNAA